jgi:hypothetical protein
MFWMSKTADADASARRRNRTADEYERLSGD